MGYMVSFSKAIILDLVNFDISKVSSVESMSGGCTDTTGHAKTKEDADRLNAIYDKLDELVFVVK